MRYVGAILILFFAAGCSGRIQTNPLPKQDEVAVPQHYETSLTNTVSQSDIDDYETFIGIIFAKPKDESKNIWDGNYERIYK